MTQITEHAVRGSSSRPRLDASMGERRAADTAPVQAGAAVGLGGLNPGAVASLKPGETVLHLGNGAGFDAFLAAPVVGDLGRVIGVDTTPETVTTARATADRGGYQNVEFRLGEIENLPVSDASVDVIISNCVINLSPDKPAVFREAFRVLRPGGRLAISDVVASTTEPDDAPADAGTDRCCIAGASPIWELSDIMVDAGFQSIRFTPKVESLAGIDQCAPGRHHSDVVVSASIQAVKPAEGDC